MATNLGIISPSVISGVALGDWHPTQQHQLGTMANIDDGRIFRYARAGALALIPGNMVQSAAPIAAHLGMVSPAAPVGSTTLLITPGAAAGAANLYAEGYLNVDTGPGNGFVYGVSGHGPITSGTAFPLYLDSDDGIREVALSSASRLGLFTNRWKDVVQTPAVATSSVAGGVVSSIPAGQYGWVQTRGPFSGLIVGTPAVNAPVINSATVAGALDVWTATGQPTSNLIGHMMQVGVGGKNNMVWLQID